MDPNSDTRGDVGGPRILRLEDPVVQQILGSEEFDRAVDRAIASAVATGSLVRPQVVRLQDSAMKRVVGSRQFAASLSQALNTLFLSDTNRLKVGKLGDDFVNRVLADPEFYDRLEELMRDSESSQPQQPPAP